MLYAIWYHLYDLKNVKNNHGGLFSPGTLLKVTLRHRCFSRFLNCANGTKYKPSVNSHSAQHTKEVKIKHWFLPTILILRSGKGKWRNCRVANEQSYFNMN